MLKLNSILAGAAILLLCACADKSEEIAPSYVSQTLYTNMTCPQLAQEAQADGVGAVVF